MKDQTISFLLIGFTIIMVILMGSIIVVGIIKDIKNTNFCLEKGYNDQTQEGNTMTCYELGSDGEVLSSRDFRIGKL